MINDLEGPIARQLPPPHPVILPATDLGGVAVLKHGNLFLLCDQFGDIHPDSRGLGLYDLDTPNELYFQRVDARVLAYFVERSFAIDRVGIGRQAAAGLAGVVSDLRLSPEKHHKALAIVARAPSVPRNVNDATTVAPTAPCIV